MRPNNSFARARAKVPSCALDDAGLAAQRERHRRLASSVIAFRRNSSRLSIEFEPSFDRAALDEMVAVERECCPFFSFSFDDKMRRLEVGVTDEAFGGALQAIGHALGCEVDER